MFRRVINNLTRSVHNSHLPAGPGGRSSWSGFAACTFGGTGFVGKRIVNCLGKNGFAAVLPNRSPEIYADDFKPMFDLGQYYVNENFSLKMNERDDDYIRNMIKHTNVVINCIGSRKEMNRYTMGEVNLDWPTRLARLVAEKQDNTKLIHLVHLNSWHDRSRDESIILQQQWDAQNAMREIYPETIIVRSSWAFGEFDNYADYLTNHRMRDFKELGAWPLLYNGGRHTFHRGIPASDLAEAIIRIIKHPDSPGYTFELYNENRHELGDIVDLLYEAQEEEAHRLDGIRTKFDPVTHERTLEPINQFHAFRQWMLRNKFGYYTARRPWPRFLDMFNRTSFNTNAVWGWVNEPYYNMLNQTCRIEDKNNPSLADLGIIPGKLEDNAMRIQRRWRERYDDYRIYNKHTLVNSPLKHHPESHNINIPNVQKANNWEDHKYYQHKRDGDLEHLNWDWQNDMRTNWSKMYNMSQDNTVHMRPYHYTGNYRRSSQRNYNDVRDMNPYALM